MDAAMKLPPTLNIRSMPPPPAGEKRNNLRGTTPISLIPPQRLLEDQLVEDMVSNALKLSAALGAFRSQSLRDADSFLDVLSERYGAPRGGQSGNFTITTFDGCLKVQLATGDFISFGAELQTAKSLIDSCLTRWADGSSVELRAIVNDAFDVGKEGKIRTDRVLALRGVKIEDAEWQRAMSAIGDAIRVTKSKRYVRFYTRPNLDADWMQVKLDLSSAPEVV